MAQQAAKKHVSTPESVPLRTPSPRVGKVKTGAWDYSRFRIAINDPDAFMDYMRGYPSTEGVTLFLYRLLPPIDLSLIGAKESNIQKGGYGDLNLFSVDAVAEKFGRGKYNIRVTDSNRPDGQREVVKSCQYKINDAERAPVYDLRTLLLGHPDAIDEVNRLIAAGILVRDASGAPRLRTAADAPGPAAVAVPAAAPDLLTRDVLGSVLISLINRNTASPHDAVKDTIEVARLLHPASPPFDIEALVERVAARIVGNKNGGRSEDAFQVYERIEGFLSRYGGGSKPSAAAQNGAVVRESGARSWVPHLPALFSEARLLIPEITGMLRELRAERAAIAAGGEPQAGGQQVQRQQQQPMTLEQRVEQIFRLGFQKMQEGVTGYDFAAYVCGFHPGGLDVYRFLEPQGTAGLMALAAMNPAARGLVNDPQIRPQLEAFLTDFFSFDPSPDEAEDEPETPAGE
jgi:hypothetical protein